MNKRQLETNIARDVIFVIIFIGIAVYFLIKQEMTSLLIPGIGLIIVLVSLTRNITQYKKVIKDIEDKLRDDYQASNVFDLVLSKHYKGELSKSLESDLDNLYIVTSKIEPLMNWLVIEIKSEQLELLLMFQENMTSYTVNFDEEILSKIDEAYTETNDYYLSDEYVWGKLNGEDELSIPFIQGQETTTFNAIKEIIIEKAEDVKRVLDLL